MADVLVVADDLTGANAAAAGFARSGFRSVTASASERADVVAEMVSRFDVVVATTDSRHSDPADAQDRVARVIRAGWPARLLCNRIDTTLRGNVGATTAALLAEVGALTGSRVVVLCAPAHPGAERHTVGGLQMLGGRRLEDTEVARDARTPVTTSDVAALIRQQADLAIAAVPLHAVTGDPTALVDRIRQAVDDGAEVLVADAITEEHLDRLAEAVLAATADSGIVLAASDPGPASLALARAMGLAPSTAAAPLLAVSGSATELTRTQLHQVASERPAHMLRAVRDGAVVNVDATAELLDQALGLATGEEVVVLATVLDGSDLCKPTREEAAELPRALVRAVRRALEAHPIDGVYSTGGDVTAALVGELGSHGLEISGEVVPLAVAGSLVGGPWDGLQLVTKGGLIGDAGTAVACLDELRRNVELHRRQVTAVEPRLPH